MNKLKLIGAILFFYSSLFIARPLNILFIVGHFPSPSQTFILNQIVALIERGHNVSIFSFHKDNLDYMHPNIEKYHLLDRVIRSLSPNKLPNCDIVFCQFGYHGKRIIETSHIAQWLKGKKVVTCLRGSDITTRIIKKPQGYQNLFKKGALFLPVCDYFKQLLIKCGCNKNKIIVHHAAIDCSKFSFKKRVFPENGAINIVSVCRLVEKKGINYAVEAVARVIKNYPNVKYYIIGDGPDHSALSRLINQLGMKDQIILCGWKSQEDVLVMLNQSHIFLLPSVTALNGNEEGIPNALKEAMATGLPVVATWHAGNPELIKDGVSGFLVKQKDPVALSVVITYLIDHPEVWDRIGCAARKTVINNFETQKNIIKLEEHFYRLLRQ